MSERNLFERQKTKVLIEQLHAYLQMKQWQEDGKIRNVATIWHRLDDEDAEILVPHPIAKDYMIRLQQALLTIANYEERSTTDVIKDIRQINSNVITVRVIHDDTSDGTIPINDGVLLIAKAKELLTAAAQSVYAKKRQFTTGAPKDAKAYLETLMLGQTEVGSFVVNVIAPTNSPTGEAAFTPETASLAQAITLNLVTGLEALEKASVEYEEVSDLKVFDAAVLAGASSNMCEALLGFSGEKRQRKFEIAISGISGPMFDNELKSFEFDSKKIAVLEKISSYYKDDYVLLQRRLTGYITKLSRPKNETFGTIIIDATLGDVERKIRVELSGDDYHRAVLAHDNSNFVRVDGDVHIKKKSAQLLNPSNFDVIVADELFDEREN